MRLALAAAFLAIFNVSAYGVEEAAYQRLLDSRSLKCTFGPGTSTDWESGEAVGADSDFDATMHVDSIDLNAGTARFIGNVGSGDIRVEAGPYGLTFIERPLGGLAVTTVFADTKPDTGAFIAVMSRHMALFGAPLLSQYHGACEVWQ